MTSIKSFVITGATSYLGIAVTRYIAADPETRILLVSRSNKDCGVQESDRIRRITCIDFLKPEDLARLEKETKEFFSEPFHVINCVGIYWEHFPFSGVSLEFSLKVIRQNLFTVYGIAYTLLPIMKVYNRGHFITFGCNSMRHHYPYMAPYTASKQALATLMKSLASEYSKWNLQFNCFLLATLKTEREKHFKPNGDFENWLDPRDVAEAVWSLTQQENILTNGSEIELMKYSEQYNWDGYFKRIQKTKN